VKAARVVVAPISVAMFPEGGGHFWVFLQWIRGLERNGCEVYWLECLEPRYERRPTAAAVRAFLGNLARVGLADRALIYQQHDDGSIAFVNIDTVRALRLLESADLLVDFKYDTGDAILERVRRSALVDIDPGLLQFWLAHGQIAVSAHDRYFTTGDHVGAEPVPPGGLSWQPIRPLVDTLSWPFDRNPRRDVVTTITNWFGEWLTDGGDFLLDNSKRVEFLNMVDLPRRSEQALELAVCFGDNPEDEHDKARLVENGWLIRHAFEVSRDPFMYRDYIVSSRGEFSCVKPSCLLFQNGWISDRTLCYLASGRPAVVQHTGPSAHLPDGEGIFRFVTIDDAAAALAELNRDYDRHCRAARELAEAHFDAALVSAELLEAACAAPSSAPSGADRVSARGDVGEEAG
jgi:hypothetical protein